MAIHTTPPPDTEKLLHGNFYICEMPEEVECKYCDSRYMTPLNGKSFCHGCGCIVTELNKD
jgi:hypothetical protein